MNDRTALVTYSISDKKMACCHDGVKRIEVEGGCAIVIGDGDFIIAAYGPGVWNTLALMDSPVDHEAVMMVAMGGAQ